MPKMKVLELRLWEGGCALLGLQKAGAGKAGAKPEQLGRVAQNSSFGL